MCSANSKFPYCLEGTCVCSKTAGLFERGDGTTQGSCKLASDKCHFDGKCDECLFASHCNGLTDTCTNGKCKCGTSPPCQASKSSSCSDGICKCGDGDACVTYDAFDTAGTDPRDNSVPGLQRTKDEVCEKITKYYNPKFVLNHPLMVNGTDANGMSTYAIDYDDTKGRNTGTYQCLGKEHCHLFFHFIFILFFSLNIE